MLERARELKRDNIAPSGKRLRSGTAGPGAFYFDKRPSFLIQRKASCACGGGCPACQSKNSGLKVSQPNDTAEIEADRIADQVMRMPVSGPPDPSSTENQILKKGTATDPVSFATPIVSDVIGSSSGRSMDKSTRSFMETRFNHDFSEVRIHDNQRASESARSIDALAYTFGNNIVFRSGQYDTNSYSGRNLLAHELTHVVQQRGAAGRKIARKPAQTEIKTWSESWIRHVQRELRAIKFYKGETTGKLDPQTTDALNKFYGNDDWKRIEATDVIKNIRGAILVESSSSPDACAKAESKQAISGDKLYFTVDTTNFIDPEQEKQFNKIIHTALWAKEIEIHGYASKEGATNENFILSCSRASAIRKKLRATGITAGISLYAHGASSVFGDLPNNRTVVVKFEMPSLKKTLTIVSWIYPNGMGLLDFSKFDIVTTPKPFRALKAMQMLLKCTANQAPPSTLKASEIEGFKRKKEFRALQHYTFSMLPGGEFNVEAEKVPGYTSPSKCDCDDVPPCTYLVGEFSPNNYVKKVFPEIESLTKFRVSAAEEEAAIKAKPNIPAGEYIGGLSLDMLPRVPWVWTDVRAGFEPQTGKLQWIVTAARFPSNTIYVDGKKVGEIPQGHPIELLKGNIRTADKPRQTLKEEAAQADKLVSNQDDTVRPGGSLMGED